MTTKDIEIIYRQVPSDIIEDFKKNFSSSNLNISVLHQKKEYFNYTGGPADIIIFVDFELAERIVEGLLLSATYDVLKYTLVTTWTKLVKFYKKKAELEGDKNKIELNFKLNEDKSIEFNLKGDIEEKIIIETIDKLFEYLKDKERHQSDFQNKDYKGQFDLKPRIRMTFNKITNKWEPINYTALKKQMDDLMRRAEEEFDS